MDTEGMIRVKEMRYDPDGILLRQSDGTLVKIPASALPGGSGGAGVQGIQGDPGPKGDKGDPGVQGIQGLKGDKGDKGDPGAAGLQGPPGTPVAELAYAEITADFVVPVSTTWTDVPGLQITVPANVPYMLELYTWFQVVQSSSAAGAVIEPQIRVMDLAAANGFAYADVAFQFPTASGGKQIKEILLKRRWAPLAVATAMKVQARVGTGSGFAFTLVTQLGNLPNFLRAEAR